MSNEIRYRAGVDIGGTFTDIVLCGSDGAVHTKKVSSTPDDYGRAIVVGLRELLASVGAVLSQVDELVHATTVATNTVLEGKGARTALITTKGFRDVVEIGRLRVPGLYNLNYSKPEPLVRRRHRYEVDERLLATGEVETTLRLADVERAIEMMQADGIEAVAVSLLHSYVNPIHELKIRDLLQKAFGDSVYITCSHEILPEIREYERTSTTVVNAYLGPVVVRYLRSLIDKLREIGMMGAVQIMHSNGGVMSAATVMAKPACIIESGPAAGVIAGAHVAKLSGYDSVITVDMGGTTAKAAIIEAGEPARTTEYEVGAGINLSSKLVKGGGHAVKLPFIDVSEIGAGGGSMVRLDGAGAICVGPDSAGSVPGPVCYDAGGDTPTLTDAVLSLGYLNPEFIAGGEVRLNGAKARAALSARIAEPAGLDLLQAAYGVFSIAAATMTRAVKAVSTYRGRDPREFAMFAFGGNGPVIAHAIAQLVEMRTVIVPPAPGVFSASGLLYSQTQHEFMSSMFTALDVVDTDQLAAKLLELGGQARATIAREGYAREDIDIQYALDLRYAQQAYELTVPIEFAEGTTLVASDIARRFHEEHRRTYGHASTADSLELVNLRAVGTLRSQAQHQYNASRTAAPKSSGQAAHATREAYFGPRFGLLTTPVMTRAAVAAAGVLQGPVIVEEYDSTCVVPPEATVSVDASQNLVINLEKF